MAAFQTQSVRLSRSSAIDQFKQRAKGSTWAANMSSTSLDRESSGPPVKYPHCIRGTLRITLQLKDLFVQAFSQLEAYRAALLACNRVFSRELAVSNLTAGLKSINQLRLQVKDVHARATAKAERNRVMWKHYMTLCRDADVVVDRKNYLSDRFQASSRRLHPGGNSEVVEHQSRASLEEDLMGEFGVKGADEVNIDQLDVPPEVDLSCDTDETGQALLPLMEFYRRFYFQQINFQQAMCMTAHRSMPLITQCPGLGRRIRGWRMEKKKRTGIVDHLEDIRADLTCLIDRLDRCVDRVKAKIRQDEAIDSCYRQHCAAQERLRGRLL
uniref:DUF5743 domain-containing protein n=1 Tax=Mesocestoides corti TaxID=53468 RepID=A0A5K3FS47_MESCO